MKRCTFLVIFLGIFFFISCGTEKIDIIFNAEEYSKISTKTLIEKLGEPKEYKQNSYRTSEGDFILKMYAYQLDDLALGFLAYEDIVVNAFVYPFNSINYKGNKYLLFDTLGINAPFGISPSIDTEDTLQFVEISDSIYKVDFYEVNSTDNTYNYAHITYDSSYSN